MRADMVADPGRKWVESVTVDCFVSTFLDDLLSGGDTPKLY